MRISVEIYHLRIITTTRWETVRYTKEGIEVPVWKVVPPSSENAFLLELVDVAVGKGHEFPLSRPDCKGHCEDTHV